MFHVELMRIRDCTLWFNIGVRQRISYNLWKRTEIQVFLHISMLIIACRILFFWSILNSLNALIWSASNYYAWFYHRTSQEFLLCFIFLNLCLRLKDPFICKLQTSITPVFRHQQTNMEYSDEPRSQFKLKYLRFLKLSFTSIKKYLVFPKMLQPGISQWSLSPPLSSCLWLKIVLIIGRIAIWLKFLFSRTKQNVSKDRLIVFRAIVWANFTKIFIWNFKLRNFYYWDDWILWQPERVLLIKRFICFSIFVKNSIKYLLLPTEHRGLDIRILLCF